MQSDTHWSSQAAAPSAGASASRVLLAEFLHRSANDLAVACAELRIAGREPTLELARDRLAIAAERLHVLASIQRLLQPPREAVIDLAGMLCDLCRYHAEARFAEQGVLVHFRTTDIRIDAPRGWAMLLIVSELLTNAARHARQRPGGMVHVDLARCDGEISCVVRDGGVGIAPASATPGFGSAIITELAHSAGIRFARCACPAGTAFELRLPVAAWNSG